MGTTITIDGDKVVVYAKAYTVITEVPNPITREHAISIAARALNQAGHSDVEMTAVSYRASNHPDGAAYIIDWRRP